MNTCLWCDKDCTFLSTCDGCCVECGDKIQKMPPVEFAVHVTKPMRDLLARLQAENAALKQELADLRAAAGRLAWGPGGPPDRTKLICRKCGVTASNRTSKYCGDGSDKENDHIWEKVGNSAELPKNEGAALDK